MSDKRINGRGDWGEARSGMAMQSLISGGKQAPIDFCGVDTPATPPNPLFHIGIFKASDFLAAVIDHIPPKGQQTVRY